MSSGAVPGADQPAIRLSGLVRRLGREEVLRGIELEVTAGRLVVLRGSNGAGKTTLLRVLATRLRPSRGSGAVYGHDLVKQAEAVRRRVGLLGAMGGNYPVLSAAENLGLALKLSGRGGDQAAIGRVLATVGLEGVGNKLVRAFSSGMKKRLGLARQLLLDPDLWLLDEPYAALDEAGKALVDSSVMAARGRGRTVLMSSHEADRHELDPDAVVLLETGVLKLVPRGSARVAEAAP